MTQLGATTQTKYNLQIIKTNLHYCMDYCFELVNLYRDIVYCERLRNDLSICISTKNVID